MTLIEASKIVEIWGKYSEYVLAKLMIVFGAHIPESFLPFPKETLTKAFNVIAEHLRNNGNVDGVKAIEASNAFLNAHVDDEEALMQAAKNFNDIEWRKAFLPTFKKAQDTWTKNKGFSNC